MEKEEAKRVLSGDFTSLPPLPSKIVRIFMSSTFTDMGAERNALMNNVYPKLNKYCRERHGLEFQVVDMRWGVRDESSDDHSTTALCLEEIKQCQQLSVGPNFVALIGQRYGTIMIPATITAGEFDVIRKFTASASAEDVTLLEQWYLLDANALEPVYILQSKSAHPDVDWRPAEGRLLHAIQAAVRAATSARQLTSQQAAKYFCSVTEEEVQRGLLDLNSPEDHCLCFTRIIQNVDEQHEKAWRFIDIKDGGWDQEPKMRLQELRDSTIPQKLTSNVFKYDIEWSASRGVNETDHAEYLDQFCRDFEEAVIRLIEGSMAKQSKANADEVNAECLEHAHACVAKCAQFRGREDVLQKMEDYLVGTSREPLVIYGDSGCGKTSVMAKASSMVSSWLPDQSRKTITILRFLGTTPSSSTITDVLGSVCKQIIKATHLPDDLLPTVPTTFDNLKEFFHHTLQMLADDRDGVPGQTRVVLFLDSVDQLVQSQDVLQMKWLSKELPPNVKFIVSTILGDYQINKSLLAIGLSRSQFVEVTSLKTEDSMSVLRYWLDMHQRRITEKQWKAVEEAFDNKPLPPGVETRPEQTHGYGQQKSKAEDGKRKGCRPLYIKLVFDAIIQWKSYSEVTHLPRTIADIIIQLFERLERKHGQALVSYSLLYLTRTKHGLTEAEMEDILSLQEEVLTDVFQYHVPPVRRLPSILWKRIRHDIKDYLVTRVADGANVMAWYHRQFREVCSKKYDPQINYLEYDKLIADGSLLKMRPDEVLVDYFTGKWSDAEKPFKYSEHQMKKLQLSDPDSTALRFVPRQPTVFKRKQEKSAMEHHFNGRKLSEMVHIIEHYRWGEEDDKMRMCLGLVLSDFEVIYGMLKMKRTQELLSLLDNVVDRAIESEEDEIEKREFWLMSRSITSNFVFLKEHPGSVGPLVTSQLVPFYNLLPHCTALIKHVDSVGLEQCALVVPHQQHEDAGGSLWYNISNHIGPVNDFVIIGSFLFSISEKIVGAEMKQQEELQLDLKPREVPRGECMQFLASTIRSTKDPSEYASNREWGNIKPSDITLYASLSKTPKVLVIDPDQVTVRGTIDCGSDQTTTSRILGMRTASIKTEKDNLSFLILWWKHQPHDDASEESEIGVYNPTTGSLLQRHTVPCRIICATQVPDANSIGFLLANQTIMWFPLSVVASESPKEQKDGSVTPLPLEGRAIVCHAVSETSGYGTKESDIAIATNCGGVFFFTLQANGTIESNARHQLPKGRAHHVSLSVVTSGQKRFILTVCTDMETFFLEGREHDRSSEIRLKPICTLKRRFDLAACHMGESSFHIVAAFTGGIADVLILGADNVDESVKDDDGPVKVRKLAVVDLHKGPVVKCEQNDELIFSCSTDGTAKVLHLRLMAYNVNHIKTFDHMDGVIGSIHSGNAMALCISADRRSAAVWDVVNGHIQLPLELGENTVLTGTLSVDEQYVAVVVSNCVKVWVVPDHKAEGVSMPSSEIAILNEDGTAWLFPHGEYISMFTRQGKHCVIHPSTGKMTERQLLTHSTPLEDVELYAEKILIIGHGGTSLYICEAATCTLMKTFDLNKQSGASLTRFGSRIMEGRFWHDGLVLTIGRKLLFWNESAQTVVPILDCEDRCTLVDGSPGSQVAAFQETTGHVVVFSDLKSPKVELHIDAKPPLMYATSGAKYLIAVENSRSVKLVRLGDGMVLADYYMDVDILTLGVTQDESFVLLGTADRRLYSYLIVDPMEPSHRERIQALPSRSQAEVMTDRLEIIRNPRYKQVKAITYLLESSSFRSGSRELHFSTDDDADSSDDETPKSAASKGKRSSETSATTALALPVKQQQNITYPAHKLQASTEHRIKTLQGNDAPKEACYAPDQDKTAAWRCQAPEKRQRPLNRTFQEKDRSRACRLM